MKEIVRKPGHAALRRFRLSRPETNYFITANVDGSGIGLDQPALVAQVIAAWSRLEAELAWTVFSGVVMPDHIHLLVQLGAGHSLTESMRLFRGRLSPFLRSQGLSWQNAFYEHRLRSLEDITPVLYYIYLNPYRAGLLSRTELWPGYFCRAEEWAWFGGLTANEAPQPEWLR